MFNGLKKLLAVVVVALPVVAQADTFRTPWGSGYLYAETPALLCVRYGDGRVSYSQNNASDSNKWVFWDSMTGPRP